MEKQGPVSSRRLSGLDAAFLYLERPEIPLNVMAILTFDGPIPFDDFVVNFHSKLDLLPRFRQIVKAPLFNIGYPKWENDPHFDIRRHIVRTRLKRPGGDAELEALAGEIVSQMLDRKKPLWEIRVVEGLKGGRGALILRLHHALVDGVAGAALLPVILDATPEPSRPDRKPQRRRQPPATPDFSTMTALGSALYTSLDHLVGAELGLLDFADALSTCRMQKGLRGLAGLLPDLVTGVERLPFNKRCGGARKFCWAEFDLADAQAIRAAAGGTINDIVLTVLTGALARYVESHGQTTVNRLVRIICPVNLRRDKGESLGNQLSFMPVVLPLDVKDPVQTLHVTAARMEVMKGAKAPEALALLANGLGIAPPPLQALFWRAIPALSLPLPLFNMICTNVPGSREPLYCVGRRMLACYPQVPTGYELGIGCAVTSYDGKLFFGLIADAQVAPDVTHLRDLLYVAYEDLLRAAGLRKGARTGPPRAAARGGRRVKTSPPAPAKPAAAAVGPAARTRPRLTKPARRAAAVAPEPAPEAVSAEPVQTPPRAPDRKKPRRTVPPGEPAGPVATAVSGPPPEAAFREASPPAQGSPATAQVIAVGAGAKS